MLRGFLWQNLATKPDCHRKHYKKRACKRLIFNYKAYFCALPPQQLSSTIHRCRAERSNQVEFIEHRQNHKQISNMKDFDRTFQYH